MKRRHIKVLAAYGCFLIAMGLIAFAASGFLPKAKTAIISGSVTGTLILISAWLLSRSEPMLSNMGRGLALFFNLAFAGVFTWRSSMALMEYGTESWMLYKPLIIGTMQVVSLIVFGLQLGLSCRGGNKAGCCSHAS